MQASFMYAVDGDQLYIVDLYTEDHPTKTVTNDVEDVLKRVKSADVDVGRMRILYKDSEARWDRIEVTPTGKFRDFSMLPRSVTIDESKLFWHKAPA